MHGIIQSLAAGTGNGGPFNIAGLTNLVGSFIGLLVLVGGGGILLKVHGRNHASAVLSTTIMMLGLAIAGVSLAGKTDGIATSLANLVFH
jgi:hypothetical protein